MSVKIWVAGISGFLLFITLTGWNSLSFWSEIRQHRVSLERYANALAAQAALTVGQADAERDDLSLINDLEKLTALPSVATVVIFHADHRVRWHSDPQWEGRTLPETSGRSQKPEDPQFIEGRASIRKNRLPSGEAWVVLSDAIIRQTAMDTWKIRMSWAFIISLFAAGFMWWRGVPVKFLSAFREALHRLSESLPASPLPPPRFKEYQRLQEVLLTCAATLASHQASREVQRQGPAQLQHYLEGVFALFPNAALMILDDRNHILSANEAVLTALESGPVIGRHFLDVVNDPQLMELVKRTGIHKNQLTESTWKNGRAAGFCVSGETGRPSLTFLLLSPKDKLG